MSEYSFKNFDSKKKIKQLHKLWILKSRKKMNEINKLLRMRIELKRENVRVNINKFFLYKKSTLDKH